MDPAELIKLLGIVIVVAGFALKLDSILIIMVAAVATAVVGGMDRWRSWTPSARASSPTEACASSS